MEQVLRKPLVERTGQGRMARPEFYDAHRGLVQWVTIISSSFTQCSTALIPVVALVDK